MLGSGFEYALQDAQPPHLFVIRRLYRKDLSTEITQAYYYVLDGTVYQAPTLYSVLHTRLVRHRMQKKLRGGVGRAHRWWRKGEEVGKV